MKGDDLIISFNITLKRLRRHGDLVVSVSDSRPSGKDSSLCQGRIVVFLGKMYLNLTVPLLPCYTNGHECR